MNQAHFAPLDLYSLWVRLLRACLVVAMALVFVVVLVVPLWEMLRSRNLWATLIAGRILPNQPVENPRLTEKIDDFQFDLRAKRALPLSQDWKQLEIIDASGEITNDDGTGLIVRALKGAYDMEKKEAVLSGNVEFRDKQGEYRVTTASAVVNLDTETVRGDDPVAVESDDFRVQGQGFLVEDRGRRVVITGQSELLIFDQLPQNRRQSGGQ
jgi:lipopolysaccharide export system protein LptC